jgi:hypothetical protein
VVHLWIGIFEAAKHEPFGLAIDYENRGQADPRWGSFCENIAGSGRLRGEGVHARRMSHRGHRGHRVGEVEAKVSRAECTRRRGLLKIVWVAGRGIMSKDAHATSKSRQEKVVQGGVDYRRRHLFL